MIYLLDVNALVALGFINHEFHDRVAFGSSHIQPAWRVAQSPSSDLCACSPKAPACGFTLAQARTLLLRLKSARASRLTFIPDEHDVSHLPDWVKAPLSKLPSLGQACEREWCAPCNSRRKRSWILSDSEVVPRSNSRQRRERDASATMWSCS